MKKAIIYPSLLSGEVTVPPSKSILHRAIICAMLAKGKSVIKHAAFSKDITATVNGQWNANGENHEMQTSNTKVSSSEKDKLAQAFITGLQNATRYEGDNSNLYIYYEDKDGSIKRMNFKAQ